MLLLVIERSESWIPNIECGGGDVQGWDNVWPNHLIGLPGWQVLRELAVCQIIQHEIKVGIAIVVVNIGVDVLDHLLLKEHT